MVTWFWTTGIVWVIGFKLASWKKAGFKTSPAKFILLSPVFSVNSWNQRIAVNREIVARTFGQAGVLLIPFAITWWLYRTFVPPLKPSVLTQCYLALIPLYCLGQLLSSLLQLLYLATGWLYPAHFKFPFLSKTLAEFWGVRWATWVNEWLKQMVFNRFRHRPAFALFATFICSGLWHEAVINVPLYLFYRVNLLGSMEIYFCIQALGLLLERKLSLGKGLWSRVYMLAFVMIPAPLVFNEGLLRIFGIFIV